MRRCLRHECFNVFITWPSQFSRSTQRKSSLTRKSANEGFSFQFSFPVSRESISKWNHRDSSRGNLCEKILKSVKCVKAFLFSFNSSLCAAVLCVSLIVQYFITRWSQAGIRPILTCVPSFWPHWWDQTRIYSKNNPKNNPKQKNFGLQQIWVVIGDKEFGGGELAANGWEDTECSLDDIHHGTETERGDFFEPSTYTGIMYSLEAKFKEIGVCYWKMRSSPTYAGLQDKAGDGERRREGQPPKSGRALIEGGRGDVGDRRTRHPRAWHAFANINLWWGLNLKLLRGRRAHKPSS